MAKLRVEVSKGEEIRYISHLDYAEAIVRAIRRAKLPAAYSEGFNPHLKLAFASALGLGVTSDKEYMDIELTEEVEISIALQQLTDNLPQGIMAKRANYVKDHSPALMAIVNLAEYSISVPLLVGGEFSTVQQCIDTFNAAEEIRYTRESPKGKREIELKSFLAEKIFVEQNGQLIQLSLVIKITPTGSVKAAEVLAALVDQFDLPVAKDSALIHRRGLFVADSTGRQSPLP